MCESIDFGRVVGWQTLEVLKGTGQLPAGLQDLLTTRQIASACIEFAVCVNGLFGAINKGIAVDSLLDEMERRTLEISGNTPDQVFSAYGLVGGGMGEPIID